MLARCSSAETNDSTIFNALTLLVVLGTSLITQLAGLSLALGAFLAGLLLAETEYHLQVGMGCLQALAAARGGIPAAKGLSPSGSERALPASPACSTPQYLSAHRCLPAPCAGRVRHRPLQGPADGPFLHDW
jgi:hypothetical protein